MKQNILQDSLTQASNNTMAEVIYYTLWMISLMSSSSEHNPRGLSKSSIVRATNDEGFPSQAS